MRQSQIKVAVPLLAIYMILAPVAVLRGAQPANGQASGQPPLYRDATLSVGHPGEGIEHFRQLDEPLGYEQMLDYAMCHMQLGQYLEAALLFELAAKMAPDRQELIFSTMWLGHALLDAAYVSKEQAESLCQRAGMIFNRASQLSPESSEAAAMRVLAWTQAQDMLQLMAAEHDLRRLGVEMGGQEVALAAGAILAYTFASVVATYVVYLLQSELTEQEKLDRLRGLLTVCSGAMWASKPKVRPESDQTNTRGRLIVKLKHACIVAAIVGFAAVIWIKAGSRNPGQGIQTQNVYWASPAKAFPVFRETRYQIKSIRYVVLGTNKQVSVFASGTGFVVQHGESDVVVTARHVVEGPDDLLKLKHNGVQYSVAGTANDFISKAQERILLGDKAAEPEYASVDFIIGGLDASLFTVHDLEILGASTLLPGKVEEGEEVEILGFPISQADVSESDAIAVANVARRVQTVSALENTYFVCEGPEQVSSGFSGGPVLNMDGQVIGMVIRTNAGQTRCLYIQDILSEAQPFFDALEQMSD